MVAQLPPLENAMRSLMRPDQIGKRRKPSTSKSCRCGKTISSNTIACRACMLEGIDKSIIQMDAEVTKQSLQVGDLAKANEARTALDKLQKLRMDVLKRVRKTL